MANPLSGHTNSEPGGTVDGLRDGDVIISPSLTNPYEGLHGNGILRMEDVSYGSGTRNSVGSGTPGHIAIGSSQGEIVVSGGYAVLDGITYAFAGGNGGTHSFIVGTTANYSGTLPSVHASLNQDVLVVIYLTSDSTQQRIKYEMGTPATIATNTPHAPTAFLSTPHASLSNQQHTVLAVVRYTMTAGAGSVTASLSAPSILDRRCFVRPAPLLLPLHTAGNIGDVAAANAVDGRDRKRFDTIFTGTEAGTFDASSLGAIWQSHSADGHSVLYYSSVRNIASAPPTRNTYRLGPNEVKALTTAANQTFRFDGPNIWLINASGNINLDPVGGATFPPGHVVEVRHTGAGNTISFDSGGINVAITNGKYGRFVYSGSAWVELVVA